MEIMITEITNQVRAKIFGLYLGCRATHRDFKDLYQWGIKGETIVEIVTGASFKVENCQLILKPLSEMTEKDCIEFLLLDDRRNDYKITSARYDSDKETIEYHYSEGEGSRNMKIQFCIEVDWLRSKGYALPYLGIDLFESKIAIKP